METEPYPHIALQESHVRNDIRDIIVSGFEAIDVGHLRVFDDGSSESDLDDVCEDDYTIRVSLFWSVIHLKSVLGTGIS